MCQAIYLELHNEKAVHSPVTCRLSGTGSLHLIFPCKERFLLAISCNVLVGVALLDESKFDVVRHTAYCIGKHQQRGTVRFQCTVGTDLHRFVKRIFPHR